MKFRHWSRALNLAAGLTLLSACGGAQLGAPPDAAAAPQAPKTSGSWVVADAGHKDLYYVSSYSGWMYAFTSDGKLAGKVQINITPSYICADTRGNVFVPTQSASFGEIVEYGHTLRRPKASFSVPGSYGFPESCASDPKTRNLASPIAYGNYYEIAVFARGSGTPTMYGVPKGFYPYFCAYDDSSDLFCAESGSQIGELPNGSSSFHLINLNVYVNEPGDLQLINGTWVLEDYIALLLYRVSISGSNATVVGKTTLRSKASSSFILPGTLHKSVFVAADGRYNAGFWRYPHGGLPRVDVPESGFLEGTAFSAAPH